MHSGLLRLTADGAPYRIRLNLRLRWSHTAGTAAAPHLNMRARQRQEEPQASIVARGQIRQGERVRSRKLLRAGLARRILGSTVMTNILSRRSPFLSPAMERKPNRHCGVAYEYCRFISSAGRSIQIRASEPCYADHWLHSEGYAAEDRARRLAGGKSLETCTGRPHLDRSGGISEMGRRCLGDRDRCECGLAPSSEP